MRKTNKKRQQKNKGVSKLFKKQFSFKDLFNNMSERISNLEIKLKKSLSEKSDNSKINRNLSNKIKEEAIKPIESWTLHGLPNVFRTTYIIRLK
jgi:hypothetical protein